MIICAQFLATFPLFFPGCADILWHFSKYEHPYSLLQCPSYSLCFPFSSFVHTVSSDLAFLPSPTPLTKQFFSHRRGKGYELCSRTCRWWGWRFVHSFMGEQCLGSRCTSGSIQFSIVVTTFRQITKAIINSQG